MNARLLRLAILVCLLGAGWFFGRGLLKPEPQRLETWAENALRQVFGPNLRYGKVSLDLLEGVRIADLSVQGPGDAKPPLQAAVVEVQHDPLAMSAGVLRLRRIVLRRPRISTHETEKGEIQLDFPFDVPKSTGPAMPVPDIVVEDGTFVLRASDKSSTFRPGVALVFEHFHIEAVADPLGGSKIHGGFAPAGLGLFGPGEEITFQGTADATKGMLDLQAVWEPVRLTPQLREILAPDIAARVDPERLEEGRHALTVRFVRDPAVEAGRIRVVAEFSGKVRMTLPDLLGKRTEDIDAHTVEEINRVFGKLDVRVQLSGQNIDIQSLTSDLAGGTLRAVGRIETGGKNVDLLVTVTGFRLDDPAFRRALGPVGETVFKEFFIAGTADAVIHLTRENGGPFTWTAALDLVDATLKVIGPIHPTKLTPDGRPMHTGFPYEAQHLKGRIRIENSRATIEGLTGTHGPAAIRVRGEKETARDGGPTGFVAWDDPRGPEVRLTVDGKGIPFDLDLAIAFENSELAGFLSKYRVSGIASSLVLDVLKPPPEDAAYAELEVLLPGNTFTYAPFPLPMTDVTGSVSLVRPLLPDGERGREFHVAATGKAAGGTVTLKADIIDHARTGRVKVTATGVTIEGAVTEAVLSSAAGQGPLGTTWRYLEPAGKADLSADLPAFPEQGGEKYVVDLKGVSIFLRPERPPPPGGPGPARVGDLFGRVSVEGERTLLVDVAGTLGPSNVRVEGMLDNRPGGAWDLAISSKKLVMTEELLALVNGLSAKGDVLPAGVTIAAGGSVGLDLHLVRDAAPAGGEPSLRAIVDARDADLNVKVGALPVHLGGAIHADGDDIRLKDVTVDGPGVSVSIPSATSGAEGWAGRATAKLDRLEVTPEWLALVPVSARGVVADLTAKRRLTSTGLAVIADDDGGWSLRGALTFTATGMVPDSTAPKGTLEFAPFTVSPPTPSGARTFSGTVGLRTFSFQAGVAFTDLVGSIEAKTLTLGDSAAGEGLLRVTSGKIAGLTVTTLEAPLVWKDGILHAPITAVLGGGRLTADARLHAGAPLFYEGKASLEGVQIAELAKELGVKDVEAKGTGRVQVEFQSRSGATEDLTAVGTVLICGGDLGALPAVANVPALFAQGLRKEKRPKFDRLRASFSVADETLTVEHLVLAGPQFEVEGWGTLTFAGQVDLTLRPQILKSFFLPGSQSMPVVKDLLKLLPEDPLYVVRVTGDVSDPKTKLVPFPFVTGRLRR